MPEPSDHTSASGPLLPLVQGDWVQIDDDAALVAVVVERDETDHGLYVKLVPVDKGSGRPFWIAARRCRRIPPPGDGWG